MVPGALVVPTFSSPSGADVFRPRPQARVLAQLVTGPGQGALPGPGLRRDPPQGPHPVLVGGSWQRDPGSHS